MFFNKTMTALAAAAFLLTAPLHAQEVTDEEKAAIQTRIDEFGAVMKSGDLSGTFDFIPGKVREHIASQSGMTVDQLKAAMKEQMGAMLSTVTFDEFGMDLANATFTATPDGSRTYGLVPTHNVMTIEGQGTIRAESQTLVMQDEGEWYLVRVDDPQQVGMLQAVYPEFAGVEFPPATMTPVE